MKFAAKMRIKYVEKVRELKFGRPKLNNKTLAVFK